MREETFSRNGRPAPLPRSEAEVERLLKVLGLSMSRGALKVATSLAAGSAALGAVTYFLFRRRR